MIVILHQNAFSVKAMDEFKMKKNKRDGATTARRISVYTSI